MPCNDSLDCRLSKYKIMKKGTIQPVINYNGLRYLIFFGHRHTISLPRMVFAYSPAMWEGTSKDLLSISFLNLRS